MPLRSNLAYNKKLQTDQYKKEQYNHIGRIKKKQIKKIKATAYISLIVVTCFVLSLYIMDIVKSAELTAKINSAANQYRIQQSENIRLRSILESQFLNSAEIEKIAVIELGMRKNISNINYINKPSKRTIEVKAIRCESLRKKENLLNRLKNWIKNLF